MTGYIDLDNLNDELRELILREVSMTKVLSVNSRLPDENGNVETDFKIIEPIAMEDNPASYPKGNSEFIATSEQFEIPIAISSRTSRIMDNGEPRRVLVRTHTDLASNVFLQEIDDNENGIFEATYYRYSSDGESWSELQKVKRIKSINGMTPDDSDNITLPMATSDTEGLVKVDGSTITVDDNGVISAVSSAPTWKTF